MNEQPGMNSIGIVGAGVMGRLLAWQLARQGNDQITLFDEDTIERSVHSNGLAAAYTAAGMLTPLSEADSTEPEIVMLGNNSLPLWREISETLNNSIDFRQPGSLVIAHPADKAELVNFKSHLSRIKSQDREVSKVAADMIGEYEPILSNRFNEALFIKNEACLSAPLLMQRLAQELSKLGVTLLEKIKICQLNPRSVKSEKNQWHFDTVIDCRGLGAKSDMRTLRGVRGETILVHAPEVQLSHIIRLAHPRYRIYIVPRNHQQYVIGATQIESDDQSPISVKSALELLSAAYSVTPLFGEARILETRVNCRPALPDNLPKIICQPGLIRVNGLYRHGFLMAPELVNETINCIRNMKQLSKRYPSLVECFSASSAQLNPSQTALCN